MNLNYDIIIINSSGGKDSQAMTDYVCGLAKTAGVIDRCVMVHADLGRVEWNGARELAEEHAAHYGIRFMYVKRRTLAGEEQDLLQHIEAHGMFPDNKNRFCTSDHKRGPATRAVTKLVNELNRKQPVSVLNCMGFRKEESPARAKRFPFERDARLTNGKRLVDTWLPIHDWKVGQVWDTIRMSGVPYHFAYDLGMPRLSCCFCIFAPESALLLAGKHNPELLDEYVRVEEKIGHTFRHKLSLKSVRDKLRSGIAVGPIQNWNM